MSLLVLVLLTRGLVALPFDHRWLEPYLDHGAWRAPAEQFRAGEWSAAAKGLSDALSKRPRPGEREVRLRARFFLALAQENLSQWKAAATQFETLFRDDTLLAPYHALHAARCHLRRGDVRRAISWADRVAAGSALDAEARLARLDALTSERRWVDVEEEAHKYVERYPEGPRRAEVLFARATALEQLGKPSEAALAYRVTWAEAPLDRWGERADGRLQELRRRLSGPETAAVEKSASDWVSRGLNLFEKNQNDVSEAAFAAALRAPGGSPALDCRARYHLAASVWKQRQRARAIPLFAEAERACRLAGDDDLTVKALYQRGRSLVSTGDRPGAVACFAEVERSYPSHSYADDARLRAADATASNGDQVAAAAMLETLPDLYPHGDSVGEALWRLALQAYQRRDFFEAQRRLDENLRRVPRATVWYAEGRVEYWQGRILERIAKPRAAAEWYEQGVRAYPLSVYSWMALERMGVLDPARRARLVRALRAERGAGSSPLSFGPRTIYREASFERAVALARLGLPGEAHRELAELLPRIGKDDDSAREDLFWITAAILDRGRRWSAAYWIARYKVPGYRRAYPDGATAQKWRLAYPRAYPELVSSQSVANAVPETLQLAIMREESGFDPRAESTANCLGLTMVKPSTAQGLTGRPVTREQLFDPANNVALGSRHLAGLLKRFHGSAALAIAAYNAGEGAVDRWLRERGELPLDEFLETIPFDETRNYTKRVLASYFAYAWLYRPDDPVPPLPLERTARDAH